MGTTLDRLAKWLGVPAQHAEEAVRDERLARVVVSRRLFLAAGSAGMAAAFVRPSLFAFTPPSPFSSFHLVVDGQVVQRWYPGDRIQVFIAVNYRERPALGRLVRVRDGLALREFALSPSVLSPARHLPPSALLSSAIMYTFLPGEEILA